MNKEYALLRIDRSDKETVVKILMEFSHEEFEKMYSDWEFQMNRIISKYGLYEDEVHFVKLNENRLVDKVFFSNFSYGVDVPFDGTKYTLNDIIESIDSNESKGDNQDSELPFN